MAERAIVYAPLDDLASAIVNPKLHDAPLISQSIGRFGFLEIPVLDERTGRLVAGHGRRDELLAMRAEGKPAPDGVVVDESGEWLVPTVRGWASRDDDDAHAAGIALNRGAESGGWDPVILLDLLDQAATADDGLTGLGFDPSDLDSLIMETSFGPTVLERGNVPIDTLRAHPRNYRQHPDEQIEHLKASLEQHGFLRAVVIARDGTILIGHGQVEAARQIGRTSVPVTRLDLDPDSPQALKILVVDEIQRFAEVDDRALTDLLRDVNESDPSGLFGTGYDEMILANLLMVTRTVAEVADFNAAAEWVGLPDFERETVPWKLVVNFDDNATRERFLDDLGVRGHISFTHSDKRTISAWYPVRDAPRHDGGLRWEEPADLPADPADGPLEGEGEGGPEGSLDGRESEISPIALIPTGGEDGTGLDPPSEALTVGPPAGVAGEGEGAEPGEPVAGGPDAPASAGPGEP